MSELEPRNFISSVNMGKDASHVVIKGCPLKSLLQSCLLVLYYTAITSCQLHLPPMH